MEQINGYTYDDSISANIDYFDKICLRFNRAEELFRQASYSIHHSDSSYKKKL